MARRKKSLKEMYDQWNRIFDNYARDNSDNANARIRRADAILERYNDNINRYFGRENHVTNEQFRTPVSRRAYMGLSNG